MEGLLQDNQTQGEKIALLDMQIIEDRSTAKAKLAQEKASTDQREISLATPSA